MCWIANICYFFAALGCLPFLLYQMIVQKKNRTGWRERFGNVPLRSGDKPCLWIHAVSLGEVNATRTLMADLRQNLTEVDLVISSTTDTGFARAKELYPDLCVFRYPLDFSWIVHRVLNRIRPAMIVLMELEVWYNLTMMAHQREIRICVVNGRFTARSAHRFHRIGKVVRPMFAAIDWVGAQTEEIADRFVQAGVSANRVEVTGSMKWDTAQITDHITGEETLAEAMGIKKNRPLVVLGSSGPGEEEIILQVWDKLPIEWRDTQLAIVPRKPERFAEVARLIERFGRPVLRRSALPDGSIPPTNTSGRAVFLGDTMGELRKLYRLADVIIVGRTLVRTGGSDPMEVAALGKTMIIGPYHENFSDPVAQLVRAEAAIVLDTSHSLDTELNVLLANRNRRIEIGRRAQEVVRRNQGATRRTSESISRQIRQPN